MTLSLVISLLFSVAVHLTLIFFGPAPQLSVDIKIPKQTLEVDLVRREVPLPEALRPKPLPPVPLPKPLDLDRLLRAKRVPLTPPNPAFSSKLSPPKISVKAGKVKPLGRDVDLRMPEPVAGPESPAGRSGRPGGGGGGAGEIVIPVGKPEKAPALVRRGDRSAGGLSPGPWEEELQRLVSVPRTAPDRGEVITGPAASRRILFRPPLPKVEGLQGSVDIELRFWVLADGSVGRVIPLKKGNAKLEGIAVNHLKRWRFSPIPSTAASREEWGVIAFRFRVR